MKPNVTCRFEQNTQTGKYPPKKPTSVYYGAASRGVGAQASRGAAASPLLTAAVAASDCRPAAAEPATLQHVLG